jgi:uncharacterized protein
MSKILHHLFKAIKDDHLEQVKTAISNSHPLVNTQDDKGVTALLVAAEHGNSAIVDTLIKHNAHINYQLPEKLYTPLMIAAKSGHIDIVKYLLKHGADPHKTDHEGKNALWYAEQSKHPHHQDIITLIKGYLEK